MMSGSAERIRILEMIERGAISAEDGIRLLEAIRAGEADSGLEDGPLPAPLDSPTAEADVQPAAMEPPAPEAPPAAEVLHGEPLEPAPSLPPETARWKRWWMVPLWIGVSVTVLGGLWMYYALATSGVGFWFVCASVPFLIGLGVMALAVQSRNAPWLHLRVRQAPGERPAVIALSFPLPIRPAVWFLNTFGQNIPELQKTFLDQVLMKVGDQVNPDNPIHIKVDEGDDGEKVEIYIG
jgi:hypothetical protein